MDTLRYISIKTQVRRLKYFSIILKLVFRDGLQKQILHNLTLNWSKENHRDLEHYHSSSGEITVTNSGLISNSFNSYFKALQQLDLIIEQGNFIVSAKTADVLSLINENLNQPKNSNSYELSLPEKTFFLMILFEKDYDIFILIIEHIYKFPSSKLDFHLQNFQNIYLERLEFKLKNPKIQNASQIIESLQRVNSWKSAKKYSEEYVPQRINWLIDLGFLDKSEWKKGLITLNQQGNAFIQKIKAESVREKEYRMFDRDWYSSSFINILELLYFEDFKINNWNQIDEAKKEDLITECFVLAIKQFSVLGISRLPAKSTLLFCSLYLLHKYLIVVNFSDISLWIGYERKIKNNNYRLRGAEREGEAYFLISNA